MRQPRRTTCQKIVYGCWAGAMIAVSWTEMFVCGFLIRILHDFATDLGYGLNDLPEPPRTEIGRIKTSCVLGIIVSQIATILLVIQVLNEQSSMGGPSLIFGVAHTAYIIWLGVTTFSEALSIVPESADFCCQGSMDRCKTGMSRFFELATKGPGAYKYATAQHACRAFFGIRSLIIINFAVAVGAFSFFQSIGLISLCPPQQTRNVRRERNGDWREGDGIEFDDLTSRASTTSIRHSTGQPAEALSRRIPADDDSPSILTPNGLPEGFLSC